MSALTYEVKDPHSPVSAWLRATFPHHKDVQAAFRTAAGPARVLPPPAVVVGTQGEAIDWWLRLLIDPAPTLELVLLGVAAARAHGMPSVLAGMRLVDALGGIDDGGNPQPMDPARFKARPDQVQARVCYALALLVQPWRAYSVEGSRLMRLRRGSEISDLLDLANEDEIADLIAMRDLARERLLPALPPGPVVSGPTFDGSADLAGDADLVVGGVLIDVKASQGGAPRKDGTRAAGLARTEIDQLLGYALMDYSDAFALHTVGIYAARFGYFAAWPVQERPVSGRSRDGAMRARTVAAELSPEQAATARRCEVCAHRR